MGGPIAGCLAPEAALGFVSGALEPGAASAVEEHLDDCADCRNLIAALAREHAAPRASTPSAALAATVPASDPGEPASAPTAVDLRNIGRPARDAGHPAPGTRIDRYVIERPLGAGGMGAVSLADDPELRRKVCLKLLRPELFDTGDMQATRARLLREAQAMAQISHPNVVAVFDIGTHDGKVFIAMEYIDGWDLAQWLRLAPRTPAQVVDVFRAAGRGLVAAHRAGLIHRDFKPQNVLIGADGTVKVADFGLARAELVAARRSGVTEVPDPDVDDAAADQAGRSATRSRGARAGESDGLLDSPLTRAGAVIGTPAYMAPEQVSGQPVDARCDQFAFAVALHEALAGERPFAGSSLTEIFTAAVEERPRPLPPRPGVSRRVRAAIARGMRARPSDRFATMDALLAELSPRGSRRLVVAAAALVAVGGGAAAAVAVLAPSAGPVAGPCDGGAELVATVWGSGPRQRIEAAFAATGLRLAASSSALIVRELDRYAVGWVAAHREACAATRERGEQTEEAMALRMSCLEHRRAELAQAVEVLESPDAQLVDNAFLLPANLSPIEDCAHPEVAATPVPLPRDPGQRQRASVVRAQLAHARVLAYAQRFDKAIAAAGPAASAADAMGWPPLVAEARLLVAEIDMQRARHDDAEKGFHAAALAGEQGGHDRIRAQAYLGLLELAQIRGKYDDAQRWAGYARATMGRVGSPPALLGKLAVLVGDVHADRGEKEAAIAQYRTAIDILTRAGGSVESAAWARFRLGNYYFRTREFDRAMDELGRTMAMWRQIGGDDHPLAILVLQTMADTRREQGRADDALPLAERAVAAYRRVYGDEHEATAGAYSTLGMVRTDLGRVTEGLADQERALAIYRRVLGPDHIYVAGHLGTIARTLSNAGRYDEAEARTREAIDIAARQDAGGAIIVYRNLLGTVLTRARKYDAAIAELERALAAAEKLLAADAAQLADTLTRLGTAHLRKGQAARAVAVLERALAVRSAGAASPWESSWTKLELARALWDARGDRARARTLAAESRTEAEAAADADQVETATEWLVAHGGAGAPIQPR